MYKCVHFTLGFIESLSDGIGVIFFVLFWKFQI